MKRVGSLRFTLPRTDEEIKSIATKVLLTIQNLEKFAPQLFSKWVEQSRTKKEALKLEVKFDTDSIESIIKKNWDNKFKELGSNFSLWSGKEKDTSNVQLGFILGTKSSNQNIKNNLFIQFPYEESFCITIEDKEYIENIQSIISNIWHPLEIEINLYDN